MHYWQQEQFSWAPIFHQLRSIQEDELAATHLPPPWLLMECQGWHPDSHHQLLSLSPCPTRMPTTGHQPVAKCQSKDLPVKRIPCWQRTKNREQIQISKKFHQKGKRALFNNSSYDKGLKDWRKSLPPECWCLPGATQDHGFHLNQGISNHSEADWEGHKIQQNTFRFSQFPHMFNLKQESASAEYRLLWVKQTRKVTQELPQQHRLKFCAKHDSGIQCISQSQVSVSHRVSKHPWAVSLVAVAACTWTGLHKLKVPPFHQKKAHLSPWS